MTHKFKNFLLVSATALALASCQTTKPEKKVDLREHSIDRALQQAAYTAGAQGAIDQSLALYERLYKRNPTDEAVAEQYTAALISAGYLEQAAFVLKNFAIQESANKFQKLEYAKLLLKIGQFKEAEGFLRGMVTSDNANLQALHLLGVALDAQGFHEQAEKALRRALASWQGDPTPILNNLALNLMAQGFLDEATVIMAQAKSLEPENETVQNNAKVLKEIK